MRTPLLFHLLVSTIALSVGTAQTKLSQEQIAFFETKIRPVLVDSCYECHSNKTGQNKGGLILDSKVGLRQGGNTGPGAVSHNLDDSMVWVAVSYEDPDFEMPPKQPLPASVIADFKKWIEMGAPDPRGGDEVVVRSEIDIEAGKEFWSFQKPEKTAPPAVKNDTWAKSDVDRYVLSKLEAEKLSPVADAKPAALIRRLYFDLIGLPPKPEQARKFYEAWNIDPEAAFSETVDTLLNSPQFGERWGRHWLDVARYAESTGKQVNFTYPNAWRYRDYVIDSFNADKPYNRFIQEQLAGDLLPAKTDEQWQEGLIATGFLALGTKGLIEQSSRQFLMDLVDEQIDTATQSVLGLTVACARCHDHKTDPIPTADYYSMAGIFLSTETFYGTTSATQNRNPTDLILLPVPDSDAEKVPPGQLAALKKRLADVEEQQREVRIQAFRERQGEKPVGARSAQQQMQRIRSQLGILQENVNGVDENGYRKTFAMGVQDRDRKIDAPILVRGEVDKPAQPVSRGFLQVLDHETAEIPENRSGRRELANWMTSEENPLTARVMVNRIWQKLFGQGIVVSTSNFGTTGRAPSHPELLDHLALKFVEDGWSVKSMIRDLVLSRTYQLSSDFQSDNYEQDPENEFLWRASPRRLDAEAIRDSMLAASGQLDLRRPRGSLVAEAGTLRLGRAPNNADLNRRVNYRSVYLPMVRELLPESLELFDAADPNMVSGKRDTTNVPVQALYLMNNPFVTEMAESMAKDLIENYDTPRERAGRAFLQTYGRQPTPQEIESCLTFFKTFMPAALKETGGDRRKAGWLTFASFCQALFSSAEFRYLN